MRLFIFLTAAILVFSISGQYGLGNNAQLNKVQVRKRDKDTSGAKETQILFTFIDKPSAYYHQIKRIAEGNYVLEIDFYDSEIFDNAKFPLVNDRPFKRSTIKEIKIDLNKDIVGLAPEMKDVVRVTIPLTEDVYYDVVDQFNKILLTANWHTDPDMSKTAIEKRARLKKRLIIGSSVGAASALGVFLVLAKDDIIEDPEPDPKKPLPGPPSRSEL
ncbi:MAG: hypothetical protein ACLFQK_09070 [Fibrobacterota bacterium]